MVSNESLDVGCPNERSALPTRQSGLQEHIRQTETLVIGGIDPTNEVCELSGAESEGVGDFMQSYCHLTPARNRIEIKRARIEVGVTSNRTAVTTICNVEYYVCIYEFRSLTA